MKRILLSLLCLASTACASIIEGTHQDINITANPQQPVNCQLTDNEKATYSLLAPGQVKVNRGDGPMTINCGGQGTQGYMKVDETLEPWTLGNILLGGLIGLGIDGATGAWQKYPDQITVTMTPMQQQSMNQYYGASSAAPVVPVAGSILPAALPN